MTDSDQAIIAEAAANILVTTDILDDVIREADSHSVQHAIVIHDAIAQVVKRAKEAMAALETHLIDVMEVGEENDIEYRGQQYAKRKKAKTERFDHDEIGRQVRDWAATSFIDDETGAAVVPSERECATRAIRAMTDIYLSDSAKAKVGELARYGIPCKTNADDSVRTKTWKKDYEIKVIPLMKGDQ